MLQIAIAGDHDVVRRRLHEQLDPHAGWEILGDARTGRQALEVIRRVRPDVAVLDLSLPELAEVEVRQLRSELPPTEICAFAMHEP